MDFSIEYSDWRMIEDLKRESVLRYGYDSPEWLYLAFINSEFFW